MTFHAAYWILLLPAFLALAWRYPLLQLTKPLRALLLLLLIALLMEPSIRLGSEGLDLWVLVDRSASARPALDPKLLEWEKLLDTTKGRNDRLYFVDFANEAVMRGAGDPGYFDTPREETRIPLAVRMALSKRDPQRDARLLLFSDGYGTEPLNPLNDLLSRERLALDYRLSGDESGIDYSVDNVSSPSRVQRDENFLIEITVSGPDDGTVPLKLYRDEAELISTTVILHNRRGVVRLADQLGGAARAFRYTARIQPQKDQYPGNNWAETWVEVQGPRPVLVLSGYDSDPLGQVLAQSGIEAVVASSPATLGAGDLSGRSAVIFNNLPAHLVSREFLKALPFFVQSQGGGLMMIGGKSSFGSGGWFQSEIDPLLPVSMELREEERRISSAMAVVLDRSGSMGMQVEGNMGNLLKMDLANEGAARTISLLGSSDMVSIIAVDSEPHNVVPLTTISGNRDEMISKARSITVGGGGIFVYTGIKAAWQQLKELKKLQRHIVLFADAADAEEPGEFKALLQEITAAKVTVSVIGLGSDRDPDAEFLKDVAARGNGRIFFVSNAVDLPAVFAQETVSVARSTFITDPTAVSGTAAWREISPFPIDWLEAVDGYNLNYLRPNARSPLITKDEYKAPLVAVWQRGTGRTAAISAPIAGDYSAQMRGWKRHGDLLQTLIGWLRGPELPPGIGIKTRVDGTTFSADLYYEKSWEEKVSAWPPVLSIAGRSDREPQTIGWERIGPGHFHLSKELGSNEVLRGVVQIGDSVLPFGPVALGRSAEWDFDRNKILELQALSLSSGGSERVNLADVWHAPRKIQIVPLFKPLLILFLLLFLIEALMNRIGKDFSWPGFSPAYLRARFSLLRQTGQRRRSYRETKRSVEQSTSTISEQTGSNLESGASAVASGDETRQSIFDKAKRGGL